VNFLASHQNRTLLLLLTLLLAAHRVFAVEDPQLLPLKYNNPGLQVDLGVGLWAWPVPCDADGDGDFDLIVSCPDKPSNGVWLFRNDTGDTGKDKFPVFKPAERVSGAVHYVMPSYVEGAMRVLSPGWEYTSFLKEGLNAKSKLPIDAKFYKPSGQQTKGPKVRHNQWRYVDYDGDGALDLCVGIEDWSYYGWDDAWDATGHWQNGPLHGYVLLWRNHGSTAQPEYIDFEKLTNAAGPIDVYGCPSPNFEDFDGDGDLDLLCGEFIDGFTYFENVGSRTVPTYSLGVELHTPDGKRLEMDLEMIVPVAFDWDRDGDFDLIVGDEDGRVALVENTGKFDDRNCPLFLPPHYFQQQADTLKCGALATPVGFDWDGDDDIDLLSGNTAGYIEYFENLSGRGIEHPRWAAPVRLMAGDRVFRVTAGVNGSIQGPAESKWGYTTLSIADWNHDGLPDIMFNSIWGRVQWLENVGSRESPQLAEAQDIEVKWTSTEPQLKPEWQWWEPTLSQLTTQWRTTPLGTDWNRDGLCDLVMLDHDGYLAFYERTRGADGELELQPPKRVFIGSNFSTTNSNHNVSVSTAGLIRLNNGTAGASGRRKICIVDWDGDGAFDILANSTSANLLRQVSSDGKKTWTFFDQGPLVKENIQGHTTSPTTVDFNDDGIPDFLGGAENGRFYYYRNPRN
jgi:hypothetical protein